MTEHKAKAVEVIREYLRLELLTIIVNGLSNSDQSKDAKFTRQYLKDALARCG